MFEIIRKSVIINSSSHDNNFAKELILRKNWLNSVPPVVVYRHLERLIDVKGNAEDVINREGQVWAEVASGNEEEGHDTLLLEPPHSVHVGEQPDNGDRHYKHRHQHEEEDY